MREPGKEGELFEKLMNLGVWKSPLGQRIVVATEDLTIGAKNSKAGKTKEKKIVSPGIHSSYSVYYVTVVLQPLFVLSISWDNIFIFFGKSTSPSLSVPESHEIWSCCCPLETRRNTF